MRAARGPTDVRTPRVETRTLIPGTPTRKPNPMATPSLLKESATEPARTGWERRRASLDERQRTLTVLAALELDGATIAFTAVTRTTGVSTRHQQHCAMELDLGRQNFLCPPSPGWTATALTTEAGVGVFGQLDDSDASVIEEFGASRRGRGVRLPPGDEDAPDLGLADEPGAGAGSGGALRTRFEGAVDRGVGEARLAALELAGGVFLCGLVKVDFAGVAAGELGTVGGEEPGRVPPRSRHPGVLTAPSIPGHTM